MSTGLNDPGTGPSGPSHAITDDDTASTKGKVTADNATNAVVELRDPDLGDEPMPEGPTVTRWEEWAYYLYYVSGRPLMVLTTEWRQVGHRDGWMLQQLLTKAAVWDLWATRRRSSRYVHPPKL